MFNFHEFQGAYQTILMNCSHKLEWQSRDMKSKVDPTTLEAESGGGKSLRVKHILSATSGKTLNVVPQALYEFAGKLFQAKECFAPPSRALFWGRGMLQVF